MQVASKREVLKAALEAGELKGELSPRMHNAGPALFTKRWRKLVHEVNLQGGYIWYSSRYDPSSFCDGGQFMAGESMASELCETSGLHTTVKQSVRMLSGSRQKAKCWCAANLPIRLNPFNVYFFIIILIFIHPFCFPKSTNSCQLEK